MATTKPERSIFYALLLPFLYWVYLICVTEPVIAHDSMNYENLGRLLCIDGWIEYFKTGPNREPLYPFFVSLCMKISGLEPAAYTWPLKVGQVLILVVSQVLLLKLLRWMNIATPVIVATLFYFGVSPAIVNSTFVIFSEIMTFPLILGAVLAAGRLWQTLSDGQTPAVFRHSLLLAFCFLLLICVKGIFEVISFVFAFPFAVSALLAWRHRQRVRFRNGLIAFFTFLCVIHLPVVVYKQLNLRFNGNYTFTNRAAWAFVGSATRRTELPSEHGLLPAAAYIAGPEICEAFYGKDKCKFWSAQSQDFFSSRESARLNAEHKGKDIDRHMMGYGIERILSHPFRFTTLALFDALKMAFWESPKIGFVIFPQIVEGSCTLLCYPLRFLMGFASLGAFAAGAFILWQGFRHRGSWTSLHTALLFINLLLVPFIGLYSLFMTIARFALPIAPLFLVLIAAWINVYIRK